MDNFRTMLMLMMVFTAQCVSSVQVESKYNISKYDDIYLPTITISSDNFLSSSLNENIINAIVFSETMHKYGIIAVNIDNLSQQKLINEFYWDVLNYFLNTSFEYKQQFYQNEFVSPGWIPFKSEKATYKNQLMLDSAFLNDDIKLKDDINDIIMLNQSCEPMESFLLIANQNKYIPEINDIPIEFRSNSDDLWNLYNQILTQIQQFAFYSLGVDPQEIMKNRWYTAIKFAYYFGYNQDGNNELYNIDSNDYKYRYGIHYDLAAFTILKFDQTKGFQLRYNEKWYNIDVNMYPANTYFIQIGNIMSILTNGYWKTPIHRVLNTFSKTKITMALFSMPSMDTIINTFSNCYPCQKQQNDNKTKMYFKRFNATSIQNIIKATADFAIEIH